MIRIKIIKIKTFIFCCIVVLLTISLGAFFTYLKNEAVPTLKLDEVENKKSFLHNVDINYFEKVFCIGIPVFELLNEESKSTIKFQSVVGIISRALANIDILHPESYFLMHLPLIGQVDVKTAMTPGVEYPVQDPQIIENEHNPSETLPEPELEKDVQIEKLDIKSQGPLVLIYHTHTTEAFMPSEKYQYKPRDSTYHTDDLNFSIVQVGKTLAQELERFNIPVVHDKTVHDVPTYMTSYSNSLKTAQRVLKENPSIKIVIDLHRDAPVADAQQSREITTIEINGTLYSRFLFIIGTDKTFPHPHWEENYQFANLIHDRLEQYFPGISRGVNLRSERFNQHVSKKAILLEIGSHGNTMEEALNSAKVFAKVLAEIIEELSIAE